MAKLYFKYGAMGSSKTATALITKYNYEERGMKVWLIKPSADRRDGTFTLKSRIGLTAEAESIAPEVDLREQRMIDLTENLFQFHGEVPPFCVVKCNPDSIYGTWQCSCHCRPDRPDHPRSARSRRG